MAQLSVGQALLALPMQQTQLYVLPWRGKAPQKYSFTEDTKPTLPVKDELLRLSVALSRRCAQKRQPIFADLRISSANECEGSQIWMCQITKTGHAAVLIISCIRRFPIPTFFRLKLEACTRCVTGGPSCVFPHAWLLPTQASPLWFKPPSTCHCLRSHMGRQAVWHALHSSTHKAQQTCKQIWMFIYVITTGHMLLSSAAVWVAASFLSSSMALAYVLCQCFMTLSWLAVSNIVSS